jgi:hypothetical protein
MFGDVHGDPTMCTADRHDAHKSARVGALAPFSGDLDRHAGR